MRIDTQQQFYPIDRHLLDPIELLERKSDAFQDELNLTQPIDIVMLHH